MKTIAIGAAVSIVLGLLGSCVYDVSTSTNEAAEVTIVDKEYHPGYTTVSCDDKGRCTTSYVPPSWNVRYEDGTEHFTFDVSSGVYDSVKLGDRRWIQYQKGGYWGLRYFTKILTAKPQVER